MNTASLDTVNAMTLPSAPRGGLLMVVAGGLLLALGVLAVGWDPLELPIGLVTLGAATAALVGPNKWRQQEALDAINSLVLASLITLAGLHLLA